MGVSLDDMSIYYPIDETFEESPSPLIIGYDKL